MDLILWRHAEAEDGGPDMARALTPKGRKQAARVARWLLERLPKDAVVIASPAMRAQQTAAALEKKIVTENALAPGASVQSILKAVKGHRTAVVVGHQPDLGRAIAWLLSGEEGAWRLQKGALWWISDEGGAIVNAVISPDLLKH